MRRDGKRTAERRKRRLEEIERPFRGEGQCEGKGGGELPRTSLPTADLRSWATRRATLTAATLRG